jgi:hypothetical protein
MLPLAAASLATNPAPSNTPITTTTTTTTAPQMATRRRALQPNHINPGMARAYEEGLGYDSTTLRTVIGNLSGGIYTALGGQARPLEGLERHSRLTNKGKVRLAIIGCDILCLPGLTPNNRRM